MKNMKKEHEGHEEELSDRPGWRRGKQEAVGLNERPG
jgi:hypothetical protein